MNIIERRTSETADAFRNRFSLKEEEKTGKICVMKFGGICMGSIEGIEQTTKVIGLHYRDGICPIVVVSAMAGVTDKLEKIVESLRRNDRGSVRSGLLSVYGGHVDIIKRLNASGNRKVDLCQDSYKIVSDLYHDVVNGNFTSQKRAKILRYGERQSAYFLKARCLEEKLPVRVVESSEIIMTDDNYGAANPDILRTRTEAERILGPLIKDGIIPIVTGFFGATEKNRAITLLGRNGSDTSAAALAIAMGVPELYLWKNTNGVLTDDPRKNGDTESIRELTFDSCGQISGINQVVHPKVLSLLEDTDVVVYVRNIFDLNDPGTKISRFQSTQ